MGIEIKPSNLQQLLQQELTRKQFVQVSFLMIISVLGINDLIAILKGTHRSAAKQAVKKSSFGSQRFGV